jgi:hypothetical protein
MASSKRKAALFIIVGSIASASTVVYAAIESTKSQPEQSIILAVAVIFGGIAQLGSTGLLVKKYMGKVDKLAEGEPALVAALESHKTIMESLAKSITDLYDSRNNHQNNLTEINTLHETKGCWTPRKTERRKKQIRKGPTP